jgi:iron complex transport system substrate-binding protein
VLKGRVFFADGNAYFHRPGPRLADSGEILAQVLHGGEPELSNQETVAWVRHKPQAAPGS